MSPTSEKASEKAARATKQGQRSAGRTEKAAEAAKARCEQNAEVIDRITHSIEIAQSDLSSLGGSIGAGMKDLRKDLSKLLKDARRDVRRMGVATKKDIERLQKDLTATARSRGDSAGRRRGSDGSGSASRRTAARRGD